MATNKSLIQARYAFALLRIAKTSDREAALRLLEVWSATDHCLALNRNSRICTMTPSKHSVVLSTYCKPDRALPSRRGVRP
jgi:hypothetical protein